MVSRSIRRLRAHAVRHTLFEPTTLGAAVHRLGFVQADPIRAPARAQDLILRHRVSGYGAGDLERRYEALDIEEGLLYAYGFLPGRAWQWLHAPRIAGLSAFEKKVLAAVRERGATHPRELEADFGARRALDAWGGHSKATKLALERLHRHGLLQIARRDNGVRVYQAVAGVPAPSSRGERLRGLIMLVARVLAPVREDTLRSIGLLLRRRICDPAAPGPVLHGLFESGELERETSDGVGYAWPAGTRATREQPHEVRLLAPFDPLVWDRRRFEHLWGWPYRFEAYTPKAKRIRGYYAMPLLWGDAVIGWANAAVSAGRLGVDCGFVSAPPAGMQFRRELQAEIARLAAFLGVPSA